MPEPIERGGPWTRHGHPIDGVTVVGSGRPRVARCGGPGLCSQCALDAARIRRKSAPEPPEPTLNYKGSTAALCRRNGWGPGTRLVGDEGYGPTVIEITAVGGELILARTVSRNGKPSNGRETEWVLFLRDWREVTDA